jgi:hypothetical protein
VVYFWDQVFSHTDIWHKINDYTGQYIRFGHLFKTKKMIFL